jgi:hypothetical protein
MERIFYALHSYHPLTDTTNFITCITKVYSADGLPHDHVTLGSVADWNVPSDIANRNVNSFRPANRYHNGLICFQGTDTIGSSSCQSNANRFASEVFVGEEIMVEHRPCHGCMQRFFNELCDCYGGTVVDHGLLEDTTHLRDGTPLISPQPNPQVWWDETAAAGFHTSSAEDDQAVLLTFKYDYNLAADDTLYFLTVLTTVRRGTLDRFERQVTKAVLDYRGEILGCVENTDCCGGRVGNVNGVGPYPNEITISDIQLLVTAKFISSLPCTSNLPCLAEADVNQSGGENPNCKDITIGDIQTLVNHLFIAGPLNAPLNYCLECGGGVAAGCD